MIKHWCRLGIMASNILLSSNILGCKLYCLQKFSFGDGTIYTVLFVCQANCSMSMLSINRVIHNKTAFFTPLIGAKLKKAFLNAVLHKI